MQVEIAGRRGLIAVVLLGLIWVKLGFGWNFTVGLIGMMMTIALSLRRRNIYFSWILGWMYWWLIGWMDEPVHGRFRSAAQLWGGDGAVLWVLFSLAIALMFVAACWKLCTVNLDKANAWVSRFSSPTAAVVDGKKDWEPITFVLGEEKITEEYRLGGE